MQIQHRSTSITDWSKKWRNVWCQNLTATTCSATIFCVLFIHAFLSCNKKSGFWNLQLIGQRRKNAVLSRKWRDYHFLFVYLKKKTCWNFRINPCSKRNFLSNHLGNVNIGLNVIFLTKSNLWVLFKIFPGEKSF